MRVNSDHYRRGTRGGEGSSPHAARLSHAAKSKQRNRMNPASGRVIGERMEKRGGEVGAAWTRTEGERERERVRDYRGHLADERHRGSFAPIPFLSRQPSTVYLPRRGDGGPARSACAAPCQTLRGCLCFLGFFFLNGMGVSGKWWWGVRGGGRVRGRALAAAPVLTPRFGRGGQNDEAERKV